MTVTITVLDGHIEACASQHKYQDVITDVVGNETSNPQTKKNFFVEKLLEHIGGEYVGYVVNENDFSRLAVIEQAKAFNNGLTGEIE